MMLVDANLLIYAYDPRSVHHEASRKWLEARLTGSQLVRFAWLTLWAFLRISTNPSVFERPLSMAEAEALVSSWLAQPCGAPLCTTDQDFARFATLTWLNPLAPPPARRARHASK